MSFELPSAGAATNALADLAHRWWIDVAAKSGLSLAGFDATVPLPQRVAWAQSQGLLVGTVLSRYSSRLQHSTDSQVQECLEYAARNKIYIPPEYLCVDEAVSGRKARRDGLERVKAILRARLASVLLVFKVSRLFRVAYKGYAFFQEEVVEEGLRAVSVSQGSDTVDERVWKPLAYMHGLMDEMLLHTIADHVRSGIKSLFLQKYVVGALTVGYRPVEVPGAPPTNRGRPRTVPQVDPEAAQLIRQHFEWVRDGMPLQEGLRRWVDAGGPRDPRSTSGHMTYGSYRRMLANPRYTGRWAFAGGPFIARLEICSYAGQADHDERNAVTHIGTSRDRSSGRYGSRCAGTCSMRHLAAPRAAIATTVPVVSVLHRRRAHLHRLLQ